MYIHTHDIFGMWKTGGEAEDDKYHWVRKRGVREQLVGMLLSPRHIRRGGGMTRRECEK